MKIPPPPPHLLQAHQTAANNMQVAKDAEYAARRALQSWRHSADFAAALFEQNTGIGIGEMFAYGAPDNPATHCVELRNGALLLCEKTNPPRDVMAIVFNEDDAQFAENAMALFSKCYKK